jgi:magnesium transporter
VLAGPRFVITVRHGRTPLHEVRLETEKRPDLLRAGPGAVLYATVDRVVESGSERVGRSTACAW